MEKKKKRNKSHNLIITVQNSRECNMNFSNGDKYEFPTPFENQNLKKKIKIPYVPLRSNRIIYNNNEKMCVHVSFDCPGMLVYMCVRELESNHHFCCCWFTLIYYYRDTLMTDNIQDIHNYIHQYPHFIPNAYYDKYSRCMNISNV